ncbi:DUF2202 domain-containing protein [Sulfurimonas sp.]
MRKHNTNRHTQHNDNSDTMLLVTDTSVSLSDADIESLVYMYQEEKLAMDVYDQLAEEYDSQIFDKISDAESQHLASVENLLVANDVDISALQDLDAGEFLDEDLQSLYTSLIEAGSTSYDDALGVGVSIENADIADLDEYLSQENLNPTIVGVYTNLDNGSAHHLSAFEQALA